MVLEKNLINFADRRKLNFERIKEICKEKSPINLEKLVSIVQYDTGLTKDKAKDYLKVLYDTDQINIDQKTLEVTCKGK